MSHINQGPALELRNISKSFGPTHALKRVDFTLMAGEIHAICGENGAGKSTLIKIMSGILTQDEGEMVVGGQVVNNNSPHLSLRNGIATIYQENSLFQHLSVAENIFIGDEPRNSLGFIDKQQVKEQAQAIFKRLGVDIDVTQPISSLGGAPQKIVEIARSFRRNARILIMDEPTASFGHQETRLLFDVIREISAAGTGIIFISHHLEEVFEIADRVTVLRDGTMISSRLADQTNEEMLIREMVGREVSLFETRQSHASEDIALETRNLSGAGFNNVSIRVTKGEVVGIAGLVGAGRTELLEAIFGKRRPYSGKTIINNQVLNAKSPLAAMNAGLCLVTEDRKINGLFLSQSVSQNMAIPFFAKFTALLIDWQKLRAVVADMIKRFSIKVSSQETIVSTLSGGNQQKVILGKWMLTKPEIFLFDEPTRGIDVGAKAEIYTEIKKLVAEGKSVLMVSSELPEIVGLSDRVYVMKTGNIVGELHGSGIEQHKILELAL
ncbi:sugar ABC transporter ATP-binding protein [Brucella gallinifaecis]|uniref:Sugar ABC transporter ATP-binding protein n=1 Tax=Brucella gallinifaecis TaxID=215590 RepID=A0A502BKN1_9HYPH|nr:sugar ABC transporter ATP-binding protein [Brucella gallinifaecis]TPF74028.1 sugar ABC transporter ATP-binding protein [Brucella gallinifaecis]